MKTMHILQSMAIAFFLLFSSCSSDDGGGSLVGTELSISDIQGTWTVTSFVFGKQCPPGQDCPAEGVDIIQEGATATMTVQANGRFTINSSVPGGAQETISGQMSFDEDLLVIVFDDDPGEEEYFGIQLTNNGNNLFINGAAEFDFDDDGIDEPADVEITMVRA